MTFQAAGEVIDATRVGLKPNKLDLRDIDLLNTHRMYLERYSESGLECTCSITIGESCTGMLTMSLHSTLFYVGGIFCAGLLVDSNDSSLTQNGGTVNSSPFVIAFKEAGIGYVGAGCNHDGSYG